MGETHGISGLISRHYIARLCSLIVCEKIGSGDIAMLLWPVVYCHVET